MMWTSLAQCVCVQRSPAPPSGAPAGVNVTAIDTPGLHASSDAQSTNRSIMKAIKRAYNARKPNFVLYVDR